MIEVQLQIEEKHRGLVIQSLTEAGSLLLPLFEDNWASYPASWNVKRRIVTLPIDETHDLRDAVSKMHTKAVLEERAESSEADRLELVSLVVSLDNQVMNSLLAQ